jgi:hypothetical protein
MMNKMKKIWMLAPALLGGLVLCLPTQADTGKPAMPSEKALTKWDKNFHPGYYEVTESPLDAQGQPVDKDSKTKKQCLTVRDAKALARLPLTQESPKECQTQVDFSPPTLTVTAHCLIDGKISNVISSVGFDEGQKEYNTATIKMELTNGNETQITYGMGTHLTYLGTCP